jgi:glycosyltransferase involved in cell wall biosynthesis
MKISIITATFNSSSTIARCIASVNEQTHPNIEHIIVDGASNDQTIEIIKNTPNRVSLISSEPDNGLFDALNKGILLATGDIVGFLHSDDSFNSPNTIENIAAAFMNQYITFDGVYGDLVFTSQTDYDKKIRFWKGQPFKLSLINRGWMPAHPTLFLRQSVYSKHGLFDLNFKIAADYDYILRIFKDQALHFNYITEVITVMRMGGNSSKNLRNILKKKQEDYLILKKNQIAHPMVTLLLKNFSKISQLF